MGKRKEKEREKERKRSKGTDIRRENKKRRK